MWSLFNQIKSSRCALCDAAMGFKQLLCAACEADLPRLHVCCEICAYPLRDAGQHPVCGHCQRAVPPFQYSISLFHYRRPLDHLLQQLKFHNRLAVARQCGHWLAEKVANSPHPTPQLILPVPLHPKRLRERGFNQALELAKPVSRRLGIPLDTQSCQRLLHTEAQTALSAKERQRNVKNAFWLNQPLNASHVAIVDDVMTTGATVSELAKVLIKSGIKRVDVWTIARAGK